MGKPFMGLEDFPHSSLVKNWVDVQQLFAETQNFKSWAIKQLRQKVSDRNAFLFCLIL